MPNCFNTNRQTTQLVSYGPKTIKLYTNKQNMDFDDADSVQETQTLELKESDLDGNSIINLRFVKFQNVSSVVVSWERPFVSFFKSQIQDFDWLVGDEFFFSSS
jgi:hypothetical protein